MPNKLTEALDTLKAQEDVLVFADGRDTYLMGAEDISDKALKIAIRHCIAQLRKVAP